MEEIKTDLLVIGAGSGGLSVAVGAAAMGAKVVLLEGHKMGGDCLNYGCVPSKALIATSKWAHKSAPLQDFGIAKSTSEVDYSAVNDYVQEVISQIEPNDSQARMESLGIRVIREFGVFTKPRQVRAGNHLVSARRIVIATGSRPIIPEIPCINNVPYLTSETIFDLREKPDHLIIIGGGPFGLEMAQAHIRLGSKVTVIEEFRVLGRSDPELSAILVESLTDEGVEIIEQAKVSIIDYENSKIVVHFNHKKLVIGTHLLFSSGRKVNFENLGLDEAGIQTSATGIKVDSNLRTTNKSVYAVGDVVGGWQFTHVAAYHASCVVRAILFCLPVRSDMSHMPWVVFTDPEMAQVGLTESEAQNQYGAKLEVVTRHYSHNDRAIAEQKTKGMIKLMVVNGRPVGVSIVGYQAGELINLWALVLKNKLKMRHVVGMISPYPTIGGLSKDLVSGYFASRLFNNLMIKRLVGFIQRWVP
ncbi:MAG: FAD-dependent oxidoreductase [Aestuariivita sp.]|nr:FAD-dependent oxidoreductase [Aestuariivita sp.]